MMEYLQDSLDSSDYASSDSESESGHGFFQQPYKVKSASKYRSALKPKSVRTNKRHTSTHKGYDSYSESSRQSNEIQSESDTDIVNQQDERWIEVRRRRKSKKK